MSSRRRRPPEGRRRRTARTSQRGRSPRWQPRWGSTTGGTGGTGWRCRWARGRAHHRAGGHVRADRPWPGEPGTRRVRTGPRDIAIALVTPRSASCPGVSAASASRTAPKSTAAAGDPEHQHEQADEHGAAEIHGGSARLGRRPCRRARYHRHGFTARDHVIAPDFGWTVLRSRLAMRRDDGNASRSITRPAQPSREPRGGLRPGRGSTPTRRPR